MAALRHWHGSATGADAVIKPADDPRPFRAATLGFMAQATFMESPEPTVAVWQRRLDPLWTGVSCHLTNPVDRLLREAGFDVVELRSGYLGRGPRPMTFMYEGRARSAR